MPASNQQVSGGLTTISSTPATGISASLFVPSARLVDISLFGGNGTVQIQREIGAPGTWRTIEEITSTSFDHQRLMQNGLSRNMRIICTAITSGTITYVMDLGTGGA